MAFTPFQTTSLFVDDMLYINKFPSHLTIIFQISTTTTQSHPLILPYQSILTVIFCQPLFMEPHPHQLHFTLLYFYFCLFVQYMCSEVCIVSAMFFYLYYMWLSVAIVVWCMYAICLEIIKNAAAGNTGKVAMHRTPGPTACLKRKGEKVPWLVYNISHKNLRTLSSA